MTDLTESTGATAPAVELFRYFNPAKRCLVSVRSDGSIWTQRTALGWRLTFEKKAEVPYEQWLVAVDELLAAVPEWARNVSELPTFNDLTLWSDEGVCETPTGHYVEPDGHGPDGVPSWLLCLGLI